MSNVKSDRYHRDLHESNLPITSQKNGLGPHQLVSDISGLPWGIISFALDSYLFITYSPQKAQKNISISTVLSPIVSCNFVFRFALLSLCLWLSLVTSLISRRCANLRQVASCCYFTCIATLLTSSGEYLLLLVVGTIHPMIRVEFRDALP